MEEDNIEEDKKIEVNLDDGEISDFFNSITGTDPNGFGLDNEIYEEKDNE